MDGFGFGFGFGGGKVPRIGRRGRKFVAVHLTKRKRWLRRLKRPSSAKRRILTIDLILLLWRRGIIIYWPFHTTAK